MFDLDHLLVNAVGHGASDIHLKSNQRPFFRINKNLVEVESDIIQPGALMEAVLRIMPPHLHKAFDDRHEADFSYNIDVVGRFRVNAFLAQGVPAVALRHVKSNVPGFADLHLPATLEQVAAQRRGIVIISGTTGAGKSTTLASMVEYMNLHSRRRIVTVEDPVEYLFTDKQSIITQREVGLDTESFEQALKYVLRQDPDVIVIGEMRDSTSLKTAMSAAETGHLVLTTLHAASAAVAVPRLLELMPSDEWEHARLVLSSVLQAVVCQRLCRTVKGGLVPATELMMNTPVVRRILEQGKLEMLNEAIETGADDGMHSFNQSLHKLITSELVSEEEGLKHSSNPGALRMALGGISSTAQGRRILMR